VRGAFTGATSERTGRFEVADGGTIFLDEIGELPLDTQVKLLRVLQEREFEPVGSSRARSVDVRVIAATNRDLEKEVAAGKFREDLYYRLKVVTLRIPPLRERPTDIPLLVEHYLKLFCEEHGKPAKRMSAEALEVLARHPWPGNVRELKNVIESLVVFHQGDEIALAELPPEVRQAAPVAESPPVQPTVGQPRTMEEIERQAILETLERTGGRRAEAAQLLSIGLRTLQRKLKDYRQQGYFTE
jgi:DNA-binding NtrC family response regulator